MADKGYMEYIVFMGLFLCGAVFIAELAYRKAIRDAADKEKA